MQRDAIDAVIVDAGGVLILVDPEAGRRGLVSFGVDAGDEVWHRAWFESNVLIDGMESFDWLAVIRGVAASVGVPEHLLDDAVPIIEELYISTPYVPIAGAAEALVALSGAGYRLGVVSNAFGTMEAQLAARRICSTIGDDCARVEVVIDSAVVGVSKPDPAIFCMALEAMGVEAHRCIYVGDGVRSDVRGAEAAGIEPVHVDPYGWCNGDHDHVLSLADLAGRLRRQAVRH